MHSVGLTLCFILRAHARSQDPGGSAQLRRTPVSSQSDGKNCSSDGGGRLINNTQGKKHPLWLHISVVELPSGRSAPRQPVSDSQFGILIKIKLFFIETSSTSALVHFSPHTSPLRQHLHPLYRFLPRHELFYSATLQIDLRWKNLHAPVR